MSPRLRPRRLACLAVTALLLGACSTGDDGAQPSGEALASPAATAAAQSPTQPEGEPTTEGPQTVGPPADGADRSPAPAPRPTAGSAPTVAPAPGAPAPPAAGEGDLQPVPAQERPTLDPVELDDSAEAGDDLTVRLVELEPVEVTGRGPGELSGPALAVEVEVANDGSVPLDVAGVSVSLAYADTEASPVDAPPADQVVGPVPAGSTVTGTYVFLVPEDRRPQVLVRVGLGASQPVVVFEGRVTT